MSDPLAPRRRRGRHHGRASYPARHTHRSGRRRRPLARRGCRLGVALICAGIACGLVALALLAGSVTA